MRSKYDNIHTVNYIMIKKQISIFIYYAPRIFLRVQGWDRSCLSIVLLCIYLRFVRTPKLTYLNDNF